MKVGQFETQTMSYERAMDCLASEFSFSDITDVIRKSIPGLLGNIKTSSDTLNGFVNTSDEENYEYLTRSDKKLIEALNNITMNNIGVKMITVPEGFKGNLLHYVELLNNSLNELVKMKADTIDFYSTMLSTFIGNRDVRNANKDLSNLFKGYSNKQNHIKDNLTKYFDHHTGKSKARLGSVVPRITDIKDLINKTRILQSTMESTNLKDFKASADTCNSKLGIIIDMINDKSITDVSKASASNIAKGAYQLGLYLELLASCYYQARVAATCVNELIANLEVETNI